MKTKAFKKTLSILLTLAMVFGMFTVLGAVAGAESLSGNLIGQFFATDNKWEDTRGNGAGLGWGIGDFPSDRQADGYYYVNSFLKIDHTSIFQNVNASTGLTLAYTYRPTQNSDHHHMFSFGSRNADKDNINGDSIKNHFYVSATTSWFSNGYAPVIGYVDANGIEHIKATPQNAPVFESGKTYDVIIRVTSSAITYWINGVQYSASYAEEGGDGYLDDFLNEISTYQYNYIGRSRWNTNNRWGNDNNQDDADFTGYVKNMRIYGCAMSAKEVMIDDAYDAYTRYYGSADLSASLTQSGEANQFNAVAYHCQDPATGTKDWTNRDDIPDYDELVYGVYGDAYRNLVYAPYDQTEWIEKEWHNCYTTFATPSNVVMVYDGVTGHEPMSPIMMQVKGNGYNGPRAFNYIAVTESVPNLQFKRQWAGYMDESNNGYLQWPDEGVGRNGISFEKNSYINYLVRDRNDLHRLQTENQSNKNTRRDYGNAFVYVGSGDTSEYYEKYSETLIHYSHTWFGSGGATDDESIPTKGNILILNYKPVYTALPSALDCYNEIIANGWMYTEASVNRAKATLAQIVTANPNNPAYTYGTDAAAAVQNCAVNIQKAVALLGGTGSAYTYGYEGLNLIKKTGTATFNYENGTEYRTVTADYGDTFTVPAVPAKASDAQYDYIDPVWTPSLTAGSTPVMSDDYKDQVYTASYTPSLRSYQITWNYTTAEGAQSTTTTVDYGQTPIAPAVATGNYQTAERVYTFSNWSPAVASVTGTAAYTAQYTDVARTYEVKFYGLDNQQIGATQNIAYGAAATAPNLPTKAPDEHNHYTVSWDNAFNNITADTDVHATASGTAHSYSGAPTWSAWTENSDGWTTTATFTCDGCNHTITPEVTVTPDVHTPTCTQAGYTVYTATVANNGTTYTNPTAKQVTGDPALDHSYTGNPTWGEWTENGDGWTVTATFKCDRCENTITPEVNVSSAAHDANCTEAGYTVYTATVANNGTTYTNPTAKQVTGDPALDHSYTGNPTWGEWTENGDGWTVTATFKCDRCENTITPEVNVSSAAHDANCTEAGYTIYTATVTNNGTTYTNPTTKRVEGEAASGHHYTSAPTWGEWTEENTVVATFQCDDCENTITPEVTVTPDVHTPTCTQAGYTVYTATVANNGTTYTNPTAKQVTGDPALDHSYTGNPTWGEWTENGDGWTVTATFKCDRCENTITPEVNVSSATHDGTCTAVSYTVYTATVTNNGTTYTNPTPKQIDGDYDYTNHVTTETVLKNAVAAGYTHTGYTGDFYCVACDHYVGPGEEIAKLNLNNNSVYTAAKDLQAEAAADPDRYDAQAVTDLNDKLAELETAVQGDDEAAVLNAITELETIAESMGANILFTLTVNEDNGSELVEKKGTAGSTVDLGTPEKEGYTFKEWTVNYGSVSGTVYTFTDSDAAATAVYTVKTSDAASGAQTILDNADDYDDAYVTSVSAKLDELNALDVTDPANNAAVKAIVDALNALLEQADANRVFTVTFTVDGETVKTEKVRTGGNATPPEQAAYVIEGDTHGAFSGWTGDYTNVTANITVSGMYEFTVHTWVDGEVTLPATCMATGTQDQSCVCGATNVKTLNIDPTAHNYGAWIGQTDPTCTENGALAHFHCTFCGRDFDESYNVIDDIVLPAHHTLHHVEAKAAGCPNHAAPMMAPRRGSAITLTGHNGNIEYWYCENCSLYFADEDATTTLTADQIIIPAAHHLSHTDAVAPTHTETGTKEYWFCDICEMYFLTADAAAPLTEEEWNEQKTIPVSTTHTPGTPVTENKVDATCTAAGSYDLVTYCLEGGEELSREPQTIPAKGHTWGAWQIVTPASEGEDGVAKHVCTVCGEEETSPLSEIEEITKTIQFINIAKMHYELELDDDEFYTIYYSSTVQWISNQPLKFRVVTYSGFNYDDVIIYANGQELTPDADGVYTIPQTPETVIITAVGAIKDDSAPSGKLSFWELLLRFIRKVIAFFSEAFKK